MPSPLPPSAGCLFVRCLCAVLVASLAAAFGGPTALARGGASVVTQKLLEKGLAELVAAERAYMADDAAGARRHGKAAERLFLDALSQDTTNRTAAMLGGQAAVLAGDLNAATAWEKRFRALSPAGERDPELHYLHAFIHLIGTKRPERALRSLQRMYGLDPRSRPNERDALWFKALNDLGRKMLEAERYEDAIVQFKTGARIAKRQGQPSRERLMISNIGVALMRADRFIEAAELYEGLIKAEPKNPVWHWQLGLCLADQSRFGEAVPEYRTVIRLMEEGRVPGGSANSVAQVHLRLGNCLRHLAQRERDPAQKKRVFDEAEAAIRTYVKDNPDDTVGHKWLGVLLFKDLDKPYEALPHFEKAYKLDPDCIDSLKYMLQIHVHYDPPPEQLPEDDPAAAAKARAAWTAVIEPWEQIIEEGEERRQKILDERKARTGKTGCT